MHDKTPQPEFFSRQIAEAKRFHLDLKPPGGARLAVVSGGRERCAPDYAIHRATFPFLALEFVVEGRGKLLLGGRKIPLAAGMVFSYGPGIPQEILCDPAAPLVKYFVDFSGQQAAEILNEHGLQPGSAVQTLAPAEIMVLFDDLIRNGLKATPFSGRITTVVLEHLLLKIAETAIPPGASGSPALATYRRCLHFIEENWRSVDTLEAWADACHIDQAYLCRLFRRFHQQSPYQVLLRHKITAAAESLQADGTTVQSVADEFGFSDAFHFSRVFKKLMGLPPTEFARIARR